MTKPIRKIDVTNVYDISTSLPPMNTITLKLKRLLKTLKARANVASETPNRHILLLLSVLPRKTEYKHNTEITNKIANSA